ncbi:hypothetical protein N7G274_003843 [Stereocaulon virgatum]|uniref:Rhodopsin domain-containing protein n=1 Tax=Stereocaulon virgatum TaxID=373712 RepID=A0ABR4AFB8_9LECA
MSSSPRLGQRPASNDDWLIVRGYARSLGIPDNMIDPSQGFALLVNRSQPYTGNYTSQGPSIIAVMAIAIALVILTTGTRLCLRAFRKSLNVGYDDLVIIPAAIGAMGWFGMMIAMAAVGGVGKHIDDITYSELNNFYWFARLSQIAFWTTASLIKISITLFNSRLTSLTSSQWIDAHNAFLVLIIGFIVASLLTSLLHCTPIAVQYSLVDLGSLSKAPQCITSNLLSSTLDILHSIFSFALLYLSTVFLSQMKMSTSTKLRLGCLFSIGMISCIGSVVRQIFTHQENVDITRLYTHQMAWSTVDIFFAITAASLPILNALLPTSWRGWLQSTPAGLSIFNVHEGTDPTAFTNEKPFQGPQNSANAIMLVAELDKDSFTRRTERLWDKAFENSSHSLDIGGVCRTEHL